MEKTDLEGRCAVVRNPVIAARRGWRGRLVLTGLLALATSAAYAQAPDVREPQRPAPADADAALTELGLEDLVNVKVYAASRFVQDVAQARC